MLHPAPTTKIDPTLARGTVIEVLGADGLHPDRVVMGFPNTDYKIQLVIEGDASGLRDLVGEMVLGRIYAKARRLDTPEAGGRRFDPCIGPPARLLGTVVAIDPVADLVVLNAGQPVVLSLGSPSQHANEFVDAEFVVCDVMPGASFRFERSA